MPDTQQLSRTGERTKSCWCEHRRKLSARTSSFLFVEFRLFEVASFAETLVLIGSLNSSQTPLHLTTLFKKIRVAEIGARGTLMGIGGIEQAQRLGEEVISSSKILFLMTDLRQGNQCLPLSLGIVTRTTKDQCLLGF